MCVRWGPSVILYGQESKALTYSFRGPQKQVNKNVVPAINYMTITKLSKLGRMPSFLGILWGHESKFWAFLILTYNIRGPQKKAKMKFYQTQFFHSADKLYWPYHADIEHISNFLNKFEFMVKIFYFCIVRNSIFQASETPKTIFQIRKVPNFGLLTFKYALKN